MFAYNRAPCSNPGTSVQKHDFFPTWTFPWSLHTCGRHRASNIRPKGESFSEHSERALVACIRAPTDIDFHFGEFEN